MGTKNSNYEKFKNLFELFEKEIKNTDKFKPNTLYGFAKYYIEKNPDKEDIFIYLFYTI